MRQRFSQQSFWVLVMSLLSFCISGGVVQGADVSGTQSGVWTTDDSPYIVTNEVVIPAGMTLRIEPGVVVKFNGYFGIRVEGTLIAIGVIGKRIIFTSIHDKEFGITRQPTTTMPGGKDWRGIEFTATGGQSSTLDNCIIRYCDKVIVASAANPELINLIVVDCNATDFNVAGRTVAVQDGTEQDYNAVDRSLAAVLKPTTPATSSSQPAPQRQFQEPELINQEITGEAEFTFGEIAVVSAAKQEQKLRETPANVTVITADEIKKMGYHDIVELLYDVMGMDINDPGQGQLDVGLRGVNDRMAMGKHFQMLLDGHDMGWRQFYRNHISTAWIGLDDIERIEIVRGPSSALWGANAFLGTINIITKSPDKSEGAAGMFTGGTSGTYSGDIQLLKKFGERGTIAFFASQYRDNIPRKIQEWSEIAGEDVILNSNQRLNNNMYFKLRLGDFSFAGHHSTADGYQSISSFAVGADYTRFVMNKKYFTVGWERSLSTALSVRVSGFYDHYAWGKGAQYENQPFAGSFVDPGTSSSGHFVRQMDGKDRIYGLESQANFKPTNNISLVMGFDYQKWDVVRWYYPEVWKADQLESPQFKIDTWALYLQGEYAPLAWAKLTAGVRHDFHSVFKEVNNGRLALVVTPMKNVFAKALYGTAFKAPSLHELYYYRKNAYYGNPTIKPEENATYEFQVGYAFKNMFQATMSIFDINITDVIVYQKRGKTERLVGETVFPESQRPDGTKDYNQQVNHGNWESRGFETEVAYNLQDSWLLYADFTYRKPRDVEADARLKYTAEMQGRLGVRYFVAQKAYVTLQARHTGERLLPDVKYNEVGAAWQVASDPTLSAPAYTTIDLAIYYPNIYYNFDLTLRMVNLLDHDNYNAGREVLSSLPGRNVFIKLGYHF
ncbi:MAG: TonB-dependent receptor [candidate division KSB1 bacterium]|nr:TonB-dependent receptor [candidate division KSB1 bacterium]